MNREGRQTESVRAAFTLVEMLMVIIIIVILMGLLLFGAHKAMMTAQQNVTQASVAGIRDAVEQFRNDTGFLPPLVQDSPAGGGTIANSGTLRPLKYVSGSPSSLVTYSFDTSNDNKNVRDYLRGWSGSTRVSTDGSTVAADVRYSVLSLPIYLMGACDVVVGVGATATAFDGVKGPGTGQPNTDGTFGGSMDPRVHGSKTYGPYYQSKSDVKLDVDATGSHSKDLYGQTPDWWGVLKDRNGRSIRYYRWLKGDRNTVSDSLTNNLNQFQAAWLNVPTLVDDPASRGDTVVASQFRDAEFAIVAAGPDGLFGDWNTESLDPNFKSMVTPLGLDTVAANSATQYVRAARKDNIVEAGK